MKKRILSIWLSVCMVLTMLPISAMAEQSGTPIGAKGEIIAFAPLDETERSVSTGTAMEDLGLPESLTATVRTAVTADSGTSEDAVHDSGNPDKGSVSGNLAEATPGSAAPTDSDGQSETDKVTGVEWKETTVDIPVTWTSEPEYDMDTEGVYVFAPVIEGYAVSAELPEITVTVSTQPLMMALRGGTPTTYGDFSVTVDEDGAAPIFANGILTFGTAGEYTIGMIEGKTSTSNVIVVSASDVMLNLDGVTIEAPDGSAAKVDGGNALTVTSDSVILNLLNDSSFTGGIGGIVDPMNACNGGSGISGNVTLTGTATLTATGGIGGAAALGTSGTGGAGISGNVTVTGAAALTATGGIGGAAALGTSGIGGPGISGNVAATDSASLIAIGGQYGGGIANGGSGISGSLTVTDYATVSLESGLSLSTPGSALTGTLTATGFIIKGGYFSEMDVITSDDYRLNQFRYLSVAPAPNVAEIGSTGYPTLQAAVDAVDEGQTIKLTDAITITDSSSITINGANSFTLDLNGKTLADDGSGSTSLIKHNGSGTLTIQDSGTGGKMTSSRSVGSNGGTVELSGGNGALTLLSGTIENTSASGAGIFNNGTGTVSIQDGIVRAEACSVNNKSGNVSVSGGVVSANKYLSAAILSSAGKVTLSGGSIYNPTYVGVGLSNSSLVVSSGSPIIQGGVAAMNAAPTVDSDTIAKVIASTNYDGNNPVENYNASQITSYKYLTFAVKIPPATFDFCNGIATVSVKPSSDPAWGGTGYAFAGWYTAPNGEGTALTGDGDSGITYYAKWTYNGHTVRTTALNLTDISTSKLYGSTQNGNVYTNTAEGWTWYAVQTTVGSEIYAANTLVLSDLTLNTTAPTALKVPSSATVVLGDGTTSTIQSGNVTAGAVYGIYGAGDLTVSGGGALSVTAGDSGFDEDDQSIGILSSGALTVNGGTVTSISGKAAESYGMMSVGTLTIDSDAVTGAGGLSVAGAGIFSLDNLTITGGTIAGSSDGMLAGYGIFATGEIAITGDTVTGNGGGIMGCGISADEISITGGTVTAKNNAIDGDGNPLSAATAIETTTTLTIGSSAKSAAIANATDGTSAITASGGTVASKKLVMSGSDAVVISFALPTAAQYAAASPAAAPDTDYVLDTSGKTLTIKTAKGAAWWSANGSTYRDYTIKLDADIDVSGFLWTPVGNDAGVFGGTFDGQGHSLSGLTITAANGGYAGLFGSALSATIQNLCVSGTINVTETGGSLYMGGIAGGIGGNSTIRNCGSHVNIRGTASNGDEVNAGGIVGYLSSGTIENCFNTGDVFGTGAAMVIAGGIYGANSQYTSNIGTVKNSYNTGSVTGSGSSINWIGALAGSVDSNTVFEHSYYLVGTATAASGHGSGTGYSSFAAGTADGLITALNGWVSEKASTAYSTWQADNADSPVNGGWPVFGAAWTAPPAPTIGTLTISDSFTAGNGIQPSGLTSYKPTVTSNGVDLTAEGWQSSITFSGDSDDWENWPDGTIISPTTTRIYKLRYYVTYDSTTIYSNAVTLDVVGHTTTLALAASPESPQIVGSSITLTATLTGYFTGPGVNGQAITFKNGSTDLGTANLNASGVAVFTWTPGGTGTCVLTAEYAATAYNTAAASSTVNYIVIVDPDIAIVAAAKTAAQGTSYADMTQTAATDEDAIKAALKNTAETAVNNSDITVTINKVSYIAPIAGTPANPSGTNGSYTFTVTVSKGSQSDTTVQKTIVITATPYTGVTDAQAVSAAKTALVDGTVNVAFGADQTAKTAAVQAYVNGLLSGNAAGVTATVTYNSGTGKYDVALSKGSVNDSKSLSMTVNVAPDPDIAIVAAAKTAAESASYANMTQAAAPNESTIKTALKSTAETAVSNGSVAVTINQISYIAPIAGTSANPSGTNGSYTFTITVSKGSQSETTAQKTIIITATPYTGGTGGGGGNGGGSGSGSNTPAPSTKPTEPVTGNTENKATVDGKGNANVSLTDKNITDAIADAKAEAAKKGVNAGDITAVIHVTTGGKDANTVTVNLPKTTQEQVIDNKISSVQLVIDRPDLTIGINLAAVTEINRQAKADVQLSATRMDNAKLSGDAKAAIGNRPAFDLKATYGSGKSVTDFGKGSVSVEIPYTLQKGEIAGNVYAVYVDAKGKVTYLTDSSYDARRGTVVFSTSHFSTYGIAYKASFNFTDINGHWAKDDILFVANRGLMTGTSATTFNPNGSMTRGMFVTALGRLADADVSGYTKSSFTDVKANAYYMGYIEWGVKNNILVGIGGGKFDPDGLVTREQMAVIMDRYATAIGFKLPEVHAQNTFADNAKIGAWAAPSVKRIQMAGIIQGKSNNLYDPQGTATRAEVSAVLKRFVELAIFNDTAQGWSMNDSGQWMYYENGKPIIGKKDIGGTTYTFDQYGVTADVPKDRAYSTYTVQRGDSFWTIARKFNCTMAELERLNNKSRFSIIFPGDVLRVPKK